MNNHQHPTTTYLKDYAPPEFLIDTVALSFDIHDDATLVTASSHLCRNPAHPNSKVPLVLDGENLELVSVSINEKKLSSQEYSQDSAALTIHTVPDEFTLEVVTRIKPKENTELSGLYGSTTDIYCTQCESQGFRRITYFLDRPDVMASYTTTIIADKKRYPVLLSNGNLDNKQVLANDRHAVTWKDPFKKPSYLFALVAGNLEHIEDKFVTSSGRAVTLQIFVEKGQTDKAHHAMDSLKKVMRWDEENYGREYDLDIFMIVAINDFNMGAMENKGLNIFNDKYILAKPETATDSDFEHILTVVGHEYLHNWTGNRITCRDWFQLSLKEGLTVFREHEFSRDSISKTVCRIHDANLLRTAQYAEDAGPLAHPVQPDSYIEISNFYTATVYEKGAEVIRMIKVLLGKEAFRKGMDLYFERHDGTAATIEDFVRAHEDASGRDLKQFRLWYHQAGTPEVKVDSKYEASQKILSLTLTQSCPPTPGQEKKLPFHIPVAIALFNAKGEQLPLNLNSAQAKNPQKSVVLELTKATETFQFHNVAEKPIISIFRDFTAPIKLHMDTNDEELRFLLAHDSDGFNRWDAGQRLATGLLLDLIPADLQDKQIQEKVTRFIDTYALLLDSNIDDKIFLAELLILPSESYLGELMKIVDVDGIYRVRSWLRRQLADKFYDSFMQIYKQNQTPGPYSADLVTIGKRRLKNLALSYMLLSNNLDARSFALEQFKTANNMTDQISALVSLSNIAGKEREVALEAFDKQWQHDPLVMDKWFSIQATSELPGGLERVKQLMQHPSFNLKNPNKVYSLLGSFCGGNAVQFHAISGAGYQFLAEQVLALDKLNPIVASRLVVPLTRWRRYDEARQKMMRERLEFILKDPKLSKDTFERVSKSL